MGSILAFQAGQFSWERYALLLLSMILATAAANLLNDYGDVRHGVDVAGVRTTVYRRHPILSGDFSPAAVLRMSVVCYAAAALICGYFFLLHGWPIVIFVGLGGLAGICYTVGPKYKYRAMGELAVFFIWGPLMLSASYFVHAGNWEKLDSILNCHVTHYPPQSPRKRGEAQRGSAVGSLNVSPRLRGEQGGWLRNMS